MLTFDAAKHRDDFKLLSLRERWGLMIALERLDALEDGSAMYSN